MTAHAPRTLSPGVALSVAVGGVLIGRPSETDRERLQAAIEAVPADAGAAASLAKVASAWLSGAVDDRALRASLSVFTAPYCQSPPAPAYTPTTHAARVADALED